MAERAGFEPTVLSHTAFRERHHQPLGHLSAGEDIRGSRSARPAGCRVELVGLLAPDAADDLEAAAETRVLGQLEDAAGGAVLAIRGGVDESVDVAVEERP